MEGSLDSIPEIDTLGSKETIALLKDKLGFTRVPIGDNGWQRARDERRPLVAVIETRLRRPEYFKKEGGHRGVPSFALLPEADRILEGTDGEVLTFNIVSPTYALLGLDRKTSEARITRGLTNRYEKFSVHRFSEDTMNESNADHLLIPPIGWPSDPYAFVERINLEINTLSQRYRLRDMLRRALGRG